MDDLGRLRRAAAGPLRTTSADLGDLPATLLLGDAQGRVVERWSGSAVTAGRLDRLEVVAGPRPAVVRRSWPGAEELACATRPVADPLTGRVLGVIGLLSLVRVYSPVMPVLVGRLVEQTQQRLLSEPVAGPATGPAWARLTAAEQIVARHVAQGLTNRETASLLKLSPHTIDYHLRRIFQKLQLRSRVELARVLAVR